MLAIQVNGEFLDLPENLAPQFDRRSPIFQGFDSISDDRTIPFNLPYTDKNARILNNPAVIENLQTFRPRYTAKLFWNGVPELNGQLRLERVTDKATISAYFTYGITEISPDLTTRSIRSIVNEEVVIHSTNFDKRVRLLYLGTVSDFAGIRINGVAYDGEDLESLVDAINADTNQTASATIELFGEDFPISILVIIPDGNELEPFHVAVDVEEVNDAEGIVKRSYWQLIQVPFLSLYESTYRSFITATASQGKFVFPLFANQNGMQDKDPIKDFPIVNYQNSSGFVGNTVIAQSPFLPGGVQVASVSNRTSLAPQITLRHVLNKIADYYDIRIDASQIQAATENLVFLSPNTLDVPIKYWNDQPFIFFRRSFNISEFVPDMTVADLIKALCSLGFYPYYDNITRTLSFRERNSVVKSPDYIDLSGYHSDLEEITNFAREGVTLSHAKDGDNRFIKAVPNFADGSLDYVFGEGQRKLQTKVVIPDLGESSPWPVDAIEVNVVTIDQSSKENFPFRLAYRSNLSNHLSTFLATTGISNPGKSLGWLSNFSLYEGLYERLWDSWIGMEDNTAMAKVRLVVPESWIWKPFWGTKLLIDRNKYLMTEFSVILQSGDRMEIEARIAKVPYAIRSVGNPGVEIPVPLPEPLPTEPDPDPIPDPDPDPEMELSAREVSLESYGGMGYYKVIQSGLTYASPVSGTTVISSSTPLFTSSDLGKRFCGLFAHQNPPTPDQDLYYPGILGSRYSTIIEVISPTQIKVDFAYNIGSVKGYIFHDNSVAFHSAMTALTTNPAKDVLRLAPGKTYVIPTFQEYNIGKSIYYTASAQAALKMGYEDYFGWSATKALQQSGTLFNIGTQSVNVGIHNVDFYPPHRKIAETQSSGSRFFANSPNANQAGKLALYNCRTDREYLSLANKTLENPQGWGWGNLYAGGTYAGSGSGRVVTDYLYLIAKNYSHRGQGLSDFKSNAGGGLSLIAEDVDTDYTPKTDFNPHYFLTSIKFTTDRSGFGLGIPSKTHYPEQVPEITDFESFYKISNIFYNQGWNNFFNLIHIGRFTFWLHPSSYWFRIYDRLFDRSGSLIAWPISDGYTHSTTATKSLIARIPLAGEVYRISRHYPMGEDKVMGTFSTNQIRDHINWSAVLNKAISAINPATEIPLNSKPIELQPGDQFRILGYGAAIYTVTHKERGTFPNMPYEYQWYNPSDESQYIFNILTLNTNLPSGLPVDFEIEVVTSSAQVLLDGNSRPAYLVYKGNSDIDLTASDLFGNETVLGSAGFGHLSYNHEEITLWLKNFNHNGYYRQSSNGRPKVSPSDGSQGYTLINCTGLIGAGEFNPPVPVSTTPNRMPTPARDFLDYLDTL